MGDGSDAAIPGEPALEAVRRLDERRAAYLTDPFLPLSDADARDFSAHATPGSLDSLIAARHAAMASTAPRYAVFCMPKSGSSFVKSALCEALQLPFVSLTGFGSQGAASTFGMNGREQELDELAIIKSILEAPGGFVAQHHTRYTPYLGLLLRAYGVQPILTIRNVLDCLVSFDDMMLEWRLDRAPQQAWVIDPYALPRDYPDRPEDERHAILARSLGVWLIQFVLSWKRSLRQSLLSPIVIRYETDILDRGRFTTLLGARLGLDDTQRTRLATYAANPDPKRSRLNVGTAGRGRARVSEETRRFLTDYAAVFSDELSEDERSDLLG